MAWRIGSDWIGAGLIDDKSMGRLGEVEVEVGVEV